jgi:acetyltransferase-like isoleucine patch superfamily enzyme
MISYCKSIGKYCSISFDVKLGLAPHPLDYISTSPLFYSKRRGLIPESTFHENDRGFVTVGHDVLISANVIVLAGVNIGNGAVIGAGAVVNKDVPPYAIVAGVPARVIRYRFSPDEIEKLQKSEFWNSSPEKLLTFKQSFNNVPEFLKIFHPD